MILDTSFVIDLIKGRPNAVSKLKELEKENVPYSITSPTVYELWSGLVSLEKSEKEKQKTTSLISEQIIYFLDDKSAEEAGKIDGKLIKIGKMIEPEDCMIAGIAVTNNQKLLTKDPHFKRIEGLKVELYVN
ncbi:PIN domain-containing protein [Candidatus Woesearchaeota archaeon]|nr:PIN domain-containing protein [Candidatus Woesearchaeota archaeon]